MRIYLIAQVQVVALAIPLVGIIGQVVVFELVDPAVVVEIDPEEVFGAV